MASDSAVSVYSAGGSPMACRQQTQADGVVQVQQITIADPNGSGSAAVCADVDASKNALQVVTVKGAANTSGIVVGLNIASLALTTLASSIPVTATKTGTLQHGLFASTQPTLWVLQTVNNATATTSVGSFLTNANETFDFKPGSNAEVSTVVSTGTAKFQITATNLSTNALQTANAYATFFWAEN